MDLIFELTIIIALATLLGFLAHLLNQPLLVAYLAAGALLSYFGFFSDLPADTFHLFSDLGIMFLLFLVGLEINYRSLRLVGKTSFIVGIGQIIFTTGIGWLLALVLGFTGMEAFYISIALAFSSTIIIVKLLSDKKDTQSLYGKISIGFMLVQDLAAILLLIFLAGLNPGETTFDPISILIVILKGLLLFSAILWVGYKFVPKVFRIFSHSQELLFLISTAWVFVVVSIVQKFGFSIEIAGFLAGLALANSSEHFQIANKIKPLRDFFILLFFIMLGSSFVLTGASNLAWPLIAFSLFVLIGNPLIVLVILGFMGYRKRTSFMAGITVAQISEFSLILAAMGLSLGHIDSSIVSVITIVGVVTITLSSYMIIHADRLFGFLSPLLGVFERKQTQEEDLPDERIHKPIVLIGFHRTGRSLAHNLKKTDLLVIDFDPEMVKHLEDGGYTHLFGDIADPDIFEKAISPKTKLIISTSPDVHDNLSLIQMLKKLRRRPQLIARAETEYDAQALYKAGATYVVLPNLSAGNYLGRALAKDFTPAVLRLLKQEDEKVYKYDKA